MYMSGGLGSVEPKVKNHSVMGVFMRTDVLDVTHLFEAEGHGEHADANDAVHHVHDEPPVRRRHFDLITIVPRFDEGEKPNK